ncbi:MAG: malonate decarboxylase subunit delta [Moraxella sp.]|nr:malonate decarboxylase subunit delta [Moraxella sp.]
MEHYHFSFAGTKQVHKKILVGCVGSGDLEVLMQPNSEQQINIHVLTAATGSKKRWEHLFDRMFVNGVLPAVTVQIHDFAATPGVIRLRMEQAFEEICDE